MSGTPLRVAVTFALLMLAKMLVPDAVAQSAEPPLPPINLKQVVSLPATAAAAPTATIRRAATGWDIGLSLANLAFPPVRTAAAAAPPAEGYVEVFELAGRFEIKRHGAAGAKETVLQQVEVYP